ncbi:hypothetical protein [Kitasatospora herbaricolor]|uniref:Gram-positive cocci surface proteins LPxTG domain-containing protein n=1 Tax=Kitasatospora herbaricolor TaxID=68217 RepID=A0ABZ1WAF2_9ACTN|nr:hypothetical protein [Kitasatospora herbaricolor]
MRASGISAFTKNVPSLSRRGKAAALAATVLLTGGVQLIGADSSWACNDDRYSESTEIDFAGGRPEQGPSSDFRPFDSDSIAANGSWAEFGVGMGNFTAADLPAVTPGFGLAAMEGSPLRAQDVRVEVKWDGAWKPLKLQAGCRGLEADTDFMKVALPKDRVANYTFRVSLSANSPQNQTELGLVTDAGVSNGWLGHWGFRTVKINHPKPGAPKPAAPKPTASKPAAPKPTGGATAKPVQVVAPQAPAASATAPAATAPSATAVPGATPATTEPATPAALAETGAGSPNGFLAGSAAAFVALGAGVLIAVRRLRNQG